MDFEKIINEYFSTLASIPPNIEVTDSTGVSISLGVFYQLALDIFHTAHNRGNKMFYIGNGGSAAIASHMATDISKNAGLRATAFNDASAITCLGNDYSFDQIFSKQLHLHAAPGDVLVAISSSGNSDNILNAVKVARNHGCTIITMSGFSPKNKLRKLGELNVYVPSQEYGFVEIMHHCLCHAITDLSHHWASDKDKQHIALVR